MADQRFLQHLDRIEKTYRPWRNASISPVVLQELELHLKEIGRISAAQDAYSYKQSRVILTSLDYIARRCFDLLNTDDYPQLFKDIEDLHNRKNKGYAGVGATDAWANFRMAQWFHITPFSGCMVRITDKFIRIVNLSKHPEADQVGESITDTLYDLAIYCLIAMCLWEEEREAIMCDGGMLG
jgi:hypothetical protein